MPDTLDRSLPVVLPDGSTTCATFHLEDGTPLQVGPLGDHDEFYRYGVMSIARLPLTVSQTIALLHLRSRVQNGEVAKL